MRRFSLAIPAVVLAVGALIFVIAININTGSSQEGGPALSQVPPPIPQPTPAGVPALPAPGGDDNDAPDGAEVLTSGPVHEAFAKPLELNPQAGPIVQKRPPDPIEELPPEEQPDGETVEWIPGYWAWDDDRDDFLWISGVLRNMPPNQTWVAGYWNEVPGGFQWTPGFWTGAANAEIDYLPEAPPESLEAGPNSPAPSENHFWIPGNWVYRNVRYQWQPGYWHVAQPDWVWVPAHYVWTPGGYIFTGGHWDFLPVNRGCLFAPVYFRRPVFVQPAFVYRPRVLINVGLFTDYLWVRPSYCHYYVGDFYAARYSNFGYRPWFSVGINIGGGPRRGYDPLFTYYRWRNHRNDRDWLVRAEQRHDLLRRDESRRPPRTFIEQKERLARVDAGRRPQVAMAATLTDAGRNPSAAGVRLRKVTQEERLQQVSRSKEIKQLVQERTEIEKKRPGDVDRRGDRTVDAAQIKKLKLPEGVVARARLAGGDSGQLGRDDTARSGGKGRGGDKGPGREDTADGNVGKSARSGRADLAQPGGPDTTPDDVNRRRASKGADGGLGKGTDDRGGKGGENRLSKGDGDGSGKGDDSRAGKGDTARLGKSSGDGGDGKGPSDSARTGKGISRDIGRTAGDEQNRRSAGTDNNQSRDIRSFNPPGGTTAGPGGLTNGDSRRDSRKSAAGGDASGSNNLTRKGITDPRGGATTDNAPRPNIRAFTPPSGSNPSGGSNDGDGRSARKGSGDSGAQSGIGAGGGDPRRSIRVDNTPRPNVRSFAPPSGLSGGSGNPSADAARSSRKSAGGDAIIRQPSGGGQPSLNSRSLSVPRGSDDRSANTPRGGGNTPSLRSLQSGGGSSAVRSQPPERRSINVAPPGGGTPRAAPSNKGKSKDDEEAKSRSRRSSDAGSPRTNMNLEQARPALVDMRGAMESGKQLLEPQASPLANDPVLDVKKSTQIDLSNLDDLPRRSIATDVAQAPADSSLLSGPPMLRLPSGNSDDRQTSDDRNIAQQGNQTRGDQTGRPTDTSDTGPKQRTVAKVPAPGENLRTGKTPSISIYEGMMSRGRSLSQRAAGAAAAAPPTQGEISGEEIRRIKDPVKSFGLGGSERTLYGPSGLTSTGSGGSAQTPRGSGSYISSSTLPQLPRFERSERSATPRYNPDPAARTYDPRKQ